MRGAASAFFANVTFFSKTCFLPVYEGVSEQVFRRASCLSKIVLRRLPRERLHLGLSTDLSPRERRDLPEAALIWCSDTLRLAAQFRHAALKKRIRRASRIDKRLVVHESRKF